MNLQVSEGSSRKEMGYSLSQNKVWVNPNRSAKSAFNSSTVSKVVNIESSKTELPINFGSTRSGFSTNVGSVFVQASQSNRTPEKSTPVNETIKRTPTDMYKNYTPKKPEIKYLTRLKLILGKLH